MTQTVAFSSAPTPAALAFNRTFERLAVTPEFYFSNPTGLLGRLLVEMLWCKCDFQLNPIRILEKYRVVTLTVFRAFTWRIENPNLLRSQQDVPINAVDVFFA